MSFDVKLNQFINNVSSVKQTSPIKNAISFGSVKNDTIELSEKAKFLKKLQAECYDVTPIKVQIGNQSQDWTLFEGTQMGSQDAFWAKDNKTNELYYVKYARNRDKKLHIESEFLANKLYQLAGIQTADVQLVKINDKVPAMVSKYESGLQSAKTNKELFDAFAVDAWLANWDSLVYGNTFSKNGKSIKIDNGGALKFRAQGALKENFGDTVNEIITLVDGRNYDSTSVYSQMSHNDLLNSFKKVCSIPDKKIQELVEDKDLAKTLINRKNYMTKVLEKMQENSHINGNLQCYFKIIADEIKNTSSYSPNVLTSKLENYINANIKDKGNSVEIPSSKVITKVLINNLKQLEKNGVVIKRENIIEFFKEKAENGLRMSNLKFNYTSVTHSVMQKKMFARLAMIAESTPQKEGESISAYVNRVVKLREKRNKQLEDFRIKNIKAQLKYEKELVAPKSRPLTNQERKFALEELEQARLEDLEWDVLIIPKLPKNATDKEIYDAWAKAHLGTFDFSDDELQEAVMQLGGRYNSKHPIEVKDGFDCVAEKDYKQEFENEPVYHWFCVQNPEKFVKELPKTGETYKLPKIHCCSTHKHYGESDFADNISSMNVKFIMHPKSETSRAYNLGYNQEVVYPKGENFKILDKEFVEYIDPDTNIGYYRWEIHMQEL